MWVSRGCCKACNNCLTRDAFQSVLHQNRLFLSLLQDALKSVPTVNIEFCNIAALQESVCLSSEQAFVEGEVGAGSCADVEAGGAGAAAGCGVAAEGGIFQKLVEDFSKGFRVAVGKEQGGSRTDFTDSLDVGGHERRSRCHCLDGRERETFVVRRQ